MTATHERCPRCDRAECQREDIAARMVRASGHVDGALAAIIEIHAAERAGCVAVDWRQRALDAEARADAAEASESYLRRAIHAEADYLGDLAETFGLGPTRAILVTAVDRLRRVAGDRAALKETTP